MACKLPGYYSNLVIYLTSILLTDRSNKPIVNSVYSLFIYTVMRKRYKDVLKSTLKACNIPVDEWQALAQDRPAWRAATRKGTKHFERSRLQSLDDKRSARKNRVPNPSTAVPCQLCGKICASTFGLQAHMRKTPALTRHLRIRRTTTTL